ncbi:right-handed parallel beta-helix repeat-containing protein [Ruegeria arenilitoris]|uniref:right-handed parallel beta-helix repeat-containing protein n=1 Tax=Ruegeria arenilitoris TaxID=1173585 RepID=UPI001CFD6DD6|nr:right-handed parallel beta-helix repeat-containing protein [Ruegeria arenilitoris]
MSTTITVTSAAELNQALSQATGGETILLAAGDYGALNLGAKYASSVTIKSADANAPATISSMNLNGASNIAFEEINFDYTFGGEAKSYKPFQIHNSSNITIDNSTFSGDLASGVSATDDGYGWGMGLLVRTSSDVTISNSEFFDWLKGMNIGSSSNVTVSGNDIHSIRSDGMYLDGNQGVVVEGNYIHDFERSLNSGDHGDFIQFSKLLGPSSNITIRDNVIDMGSGDWAQSIFMGSGHSDPGDPAMFYTNVLIENNTIYNAHTHGISVAGAKDLTIANNTVLAVPGALTGGVSVPKIFVSGGSQDVTIKQNVVSAISGPSGQPDWNVTDNALVQTHQYDNVFTYYATGAQDGYNQYGVIPGSIVDNLNAGSDLAQLFPFSYDAWVGTATSGGTTQPGGGTTQPGGGTTQPDSGTTQPDSGTTQPDSGTTQPDSGTTQPDSGTTQPDSGTTQPDSGKTQPDSGTTQPDSGTTRPDSGTTQPDSGVTQPDSSQSSQMMFDDFVLDIGGLLNQDEIGLKGDTTVVNTGSGPVVEFDGKDDYLNLGRLEEFSGSSELGFTIEFARDEADGSAQRLVWNHQKIGLILKDDGLVVKVANNDAKFHKGFKAKDIGLNDLEKHEITVLVDEDEDRLQVLVDDQVVIDETGVDLDFSDVNNRNWTIGSQWGADIDGEVSAFGIDDEVDFVDTTVFDNALIA